jgi:hypothetical protein
MSDILRIKFGRSDRTYRVGERVTGWVMVQNSRGGDCNGVRIRRFWRTHGKGNEDKGDVAGTTLHRGPLPDDGPHLFEFDFPAPAGPFTYRGRYLNVDQYVEARVDLPFARDPTVREEYLLLPGKPVAPPPALLEMPENPIKTLLPPLAGFLGISVSVVGLMVLLTANPVGLVFLLVALILFLPILKRKADERLGKSASARLSSVVAGPGEEVGVEVKVAPPKPVELNRAFVELRALEVCVSGSGSNRRTHRHTVFSGGTSLSGAILLEAGAVKLLNGTVRIPDDAPSSFKGTANKLLWEAKVRLDIPSWPDWVKQIPLVVWPTKDHLGAGGEVEVLARPEDGVFEETSLPLAKPGFPEPEPHVTGPPPWWRQVETEVEQEATAEVEPAVEPGVVQEVAAEVDPAVEVDLETAVDLELAEEPKASVELEPTTELWSDPLQPEPAEGTRKPASSEPDLPALVKAINDAGIFGRERDLLIDDLVGMFFEVALEVRRVDRTIGIYTEAEYRDGQTVTGVLIGSDLEVVVYFPSDRNDEIKQWAPGSVHSVQAEVNDWDRLRKRPELMARG